MHVRGSVGVCSVRVQQLVSVLDSNVPLMDSGLNRVSVIFGKSSMPFRTLASQPTRTVHKKYTCIYMYFTILTLKSQSVLRDDKFLNM